MSSLSSIEEFARFRTTHLDYAQAYVANQASTGESNPTDVGTGGTPFIPYLRKHRDETLAHRIMRS
ncbi:MAG: hypothetical protein WD768_20700 [Phycisphaeraceae bacterium]